MGDGIQNKFALIFNGDDAEHHLANVDRAVETLKSEGGGYRISVVSPNKPKEAGINYFSASAQGLDNVVKGLGDMDDDDLFVVYVTGHGGEGEHGEGSVVLPDGQFSLEKLGVNLNHLKFGRRLLVMDQCYGANGIDQFADSKTSILTAGAKGETVQCSRFSGSFWSLNVPDTNSDGVVTIQERYDYAASQDPLFASVSQYLNPTDEISLSGQKVDGQWPKEVKDVSSRSELEAETGKLRHGQLALVTFSADWCGACHEYANQFNNLPEKYNGRYLMLRLEGRLGSEKEWASYYGIEAMPTVAFIDSDGKVTKVPDELRNDPEQYLAKAVTKTDEDEVAAFSRKILYGDAERRKKALYTIDQNFLKSLNDRSSLLIEPLVSCLHDSNTQIQTAALSALEKFGDQAASAWNDIVQCLSSEDSHVRGNAIDTLGTIPEKRTESIPIILKQAEDDKDVYVRYSTALALENLGDIKNAVIVLCDLAKDKEAQGMSLSHLETMGPKAVDAVSTVLPLIGSSVSLGTRLQAIEALGAIGTNHGDATDRSFADIATPQLIPGLDDSNAGIRLQTLIALDKMQVRSPELVEKFKALLMDNDPRVAVEAAFALGNCGEFAEAAVPDLIESARHGQTLEIQIYSTLALSSIDPKNKEALGAVKYIINHIQPSVEQVHLAEALYTMGATNLALQYLRKNLRTNNKMIQTEVLQAMETMGAKAAPLTPEIITLTYSSDPWLLVGALQALGNIGPDAKKAVPRLNELSQQETISGQFAKQALEQIQK